MSALALLAAGCKSKPCGSPCAPEPHGADLRAAALRAGPVAVRSAALRRPDAEADGPFQRAPTPPPMSQPPVVDDDSPGASRDDEDRRRGEEPPSRRAGGPARLDGARSTPRRGPCGAGNPGAEDAARKLADELKGIPGAQVMVEGTQRRRDRHGQLRVGLRQAASRTRTSARPCVRPRQAMARHPEAKVSVVGHTDSAPITKVDSGRATSPSRGPAPRPSPAPWRRTASSRDRMRVDGRGPERPARRPPRRRLPTGRRTVASRSSSRSASPRPRRRGTDRTPARPSLSPRGPAVLRRPSSFSPALPAAGAGPAPSARGGLQRAGATVERGARRFVPPARAPPPGRPSHPLHVHVEATHQASSGGTPTVDRARAKIPPWWGQSDRRVVGMATATIEELLQILVERRGSDLHLSAGSPPRIRVDGSLVSTEHEVLKPEVVKRLIYSFLSGEQVARFEKDFEIDLSFGVDGLGRFRTNVFLQRGHGRGGAAHDPVPDPDVRRARAPDEDLRGDLQPPARARPRDGRHRLGQVDDAGRDDRLRQRAQRAAHRHGRGPDRVPPPQQVVPRQPARDRRRHADLQARAPQRPAPGPRRRARGRDARHRDHRGGADDRRDRPPDLRHPAHERLRPDDQPHRRRLPRAPAAAGAHAALLLAPGRALPAAPAARRRARAARSRSRR